MLPGKGKEPAVLLPDHGTKRPKSLLSIDSSSSELPLSPLPTRKKLKVYDEDTILRSTHVDQPPVPFQPRNDPHTVGTNLRNTKGRNHKPHIAFQSSALAGGLHAADLTRGLAVPPVKDLTDDKAGASTAQGTIRSRPSSTDTNSPESDTSITMDDGSSVSEEAEEYKSFQVQLKVATEVAISAERPVQMHEATGRSLNLLEAANYKFVASNKQQSFELYAKLVEPDYSSRPVLSQAVLSCARAAETPSQRQYARHLLLKRLECAEESIAVSSQMQLTHMLLAKSYAMDSNEAAFFDLSDRRSALHHRRSALQMTRIYNFDVSFDMLTYLCNKHVSYSLYDGKDQKEPIGHDDFVQFTQTLRWSNSPNPTRVSELQDDSSSTLFDCARSCIDWCAASVNGAPLAHYRNLKGLAKGSSTDISNGWSPESTAIYLYFNDRRLHDESFNPKSAILWIRKTWEGLKISKAELLMVCCDLITDVITVYQFGLAQNDNKVTNYQWQASNLRKSIEILQRLPREELVTRFLRRLFERTKDVVASGNQSMAGIDETYLQTVPYPESYPLMLRPPPLLRGTIIRDTLVFVGFEDWPRTESQHESSMREIGYDPTMASSCRSSISSYRRMRSAANSMFRGRAQTANSIRSRSSRATTTSLYFTGSIDDLSDMMTDSFSIAERPNEEDIIEQGMT